MILYGYIKTSHKDIVFVSPSDDGLSSVMLITPTDVSVERCIHLSPTPASSDSRPAGARVPLPLLTLRERERETTGESRWTDIWI